MMNGDRFISKYQSNYHHYFSRRTSTDVGILYCQSSRSYTAPNLLLVTFTRSSFHGAGGDPPTLHFMKFQVSQVLSISLYIRIRHQQQQRHKLVLRARYSANSITTSKKITNRLFSNKIAWKSQRNKRCFNRTIA